MNKSNRNGAIPLPAEAGSPLAPSPMDSLVRRKLAEKHAEKYYSRYTITDKGLQLLQKLEDSSS